MNKIAKKFKHKIFVPILFVLLIILTSFTACQSTPGQDAIGQKDNDILRDAIKQTAASTDYIQNDYEEKWEYKKDYESSHRLTVNAMILNQNMTNVPVITVQEKPFEGGEQIKKIVKTFCPDAKVYDRIGLTKSQIQELIIIYEQKLYQLENGADNEQTGIEIAGGYDPNKPLDEQIKATIEQLKADYNNAPSDADLKEADYQFTMKGGTLQSNMEAVKDGLIVNFDFVNWSTNNSIYLGSTFIMEDRAYTSDDDGSKICDSFVMPTSLAEDAEFRKEKEIIDQYVNDMGINYMSLQSVCRSENGYDYYYSRTVNGFPETYTKTYLGTQTIDSEGIIVMDLWKPEYLHIQTQNGKAVYVKWNNPSEVVTIDNENVLTKSWEEIQKKFLNQMDYLLSPRPVGTGDQINSPVFSENTEIVINRIEFGLTKIIMKDTKEYKLIPTWSFMGYDSNYAKKDVNTGAEICFLTINAIDGTIIDRGLMY